MPVFRSLIMPLSIVTATLLAAAGSARAEKVIYGDCSLTIDGRSYIDIKGDCPIYLYQDGDGSFMINSDGEHAIRGYFAQVMPNGDGTASAFWNGERGASHAQAPLGENLRRDGGCWSNRRASVCAYKGDGGTRRSGGYTASPERDNRNYSR